MTRSMAPPGFFEVSAQSRPHLSTDYRFYRYQGKFEFVWKSERCNHEFLEFELAGVNTLNILLAGRSNKRYWQKSPLWDGECSRQLSDYWIKHLLNRRQLFPTEYCIHAFVETRA